MANEKPEWILFCGAEGVGKTSLIHSWIDRSFSSPKATEGIAIKSHTLKVGEQSIPLSIYDISGQKKSCELISSYARYSCFVVFVFDVHNLASFKVLNTYIEKIQQHYSPGNQTMHYILVANKIEDTLDRVVSSQDAEKFAEENQAQYIEVSAKHGVGIKDLENFITQKIIQKSTRAMPAAAPVKDAQHPKLVQKIIGLAQQFQGNKYISDICTVLLFGSQERNAHAYFFPKFPGLKDSLISLERHWFSVLNSVINIALTLGLVASVASVPLMYCLGISSGLGWAVAALVVLTSHSIVNKRSSGYAFMFFAFAEKQQAQLLCNEVFKETGSSLRI